MAESDVRQSRPKRSTRGQRASVATAEGDEEFWTQEFFKDDEENDIDYRTEEDEEDVVDADFDMPEDVGNEDEEAQKAEKDANRDGKEKKKSVYKDPKAKKKAPVTRAPVVKRQKRIVREPQSDSDSDASVRVVDVMSGGEGEPSAETSAAGAGTSAAALGATRKSQRTVVAERNAVRQRQQAIDAKRKALQPRRHRAPEYRRLTQEEMLMEAVQTEQYNLVSLADLLKIEEELKRVTQPKDRVEGAKVIYKSTADGTTISFTNGADLPAFFNAIPPTPAEKPVCSISNLPARYLDPLSGRPYATIAAFTAIRQQYQKDQELKRSKKRAEAAVS